MFKTFITKSLIREGVASVSTQLKVRAGRGHWIQDTGCY